MAPPVNPMLKHRNEMIVKARVEGLTYREIGLQFGITGSRVKQIVAKAARRAAAAGKK